MLFPEQCRPRYERVSNILVDDFGALRDTNTSYWDRDHFLHVQGTHAILYTIETFLRNLRNSPGLPSLSLAHSSKKRFQIYEVFLGIGKDAVFFTSIGYV